VLLNIFKASPKHRILDPFCGSGTTIVEAEHLGIPSCGIDLNPLAVFITNGKIKLLHSNVDALKRTLITIRDLFHRGHLRLAGTGARIEYLKKWFDEDILSDIENLRNCILKIAGESSPFFLLVASDLLRGYSDQDPGDLRIRRRKSPLPKVLFIDAWCKLCEYHISALAAVQPYLLRKKIGSKAMVADAKALTRPTNKWIIKPPYDFVITSPPYATALPYIDTQRLSLVWLELVKAAEIRKLEAEVLGSREILKDRQSLELAMRGNQAQLPEKVYKFCLSMESMLTSEDGFRRRAMPILLYRYLGGMRDVFHQLYQTLRTDGRMAWIVGFNQTTLGGHVLQIDTPALLNQVAIQAGFKVEETVPLQTYQRFDVHQKNSIREEAALIYKK